jgi:hypothetical protein
MEANTNNSNKISFFIEGATLIFKKWSSFRTSLDHNPQVLSEYANEENTDLEINQMLNMLFDDILKEMNKETGCVLENNIADMLFYFIEEFFEIEIGDQDEFFVAKSLIKLYNEIVAGKNEYLEKLKSIDSKFNYSIYSIEFPINMNKVLAKEFEEKIDLKDNEMDVSPDNLINEGMEQSKPDNNKASKFSEPDDEGFVTVKKGKKF